MSAIPSYKPSGKFEPSTLPFALGLGLVVGAAGVGWLYQLFVYWVPLVYINILATVGFGFALGALVGYGAQLGKCRNLMLAAVLALICAVAAEGITMYYAYQRFLGKVAEHQQKRLERAFRGRPVPAKMLAQQKKRIAERLTFQKYIQLRVKSGWRIRRSLKLTGVMVYIIWGIELLILIGISVFVSRSMVSDPYCERGNRWAEAITLGDWPGVDPGYLEEAAAVGDLNAFVDVEGIPTDPDLPTLAVYKVYQCDTVGYLSVTLKIVEENEKGEASEQSKELLEYAMVDARQVEELRAIFGT